MSPTTEQQTELLSEHSLAAALEHVECASVIVCGAAAAQAARALVCDEGPYPGRFLVTVDPNRPLAAWELF